MKIMREGCRPGDILYNGVLSAFVLGQLLMPVRSAQLRHQNDIGEKFFSYDYSKHGLDWSAGSCASRTRQSPIDLPPVAPITGIFMFRYVPMADPFEILNTGKTLSIDMVGHHYGGVMYDNAYYDLMNINVHSYSEHTWAGIRKPLELHLVHKKFDTEDLIIVAVPIEGSTPALPTALAQVNASAGLNLRGSAAQAPPGLLPAPPIAPYAQPPATEANFNPALQAFLAKEPPPPNTKVEVPADEKHSYDIGSLLQGTLFYEYGGSLTAPPCLEEVTWLVRGTAIKASDKQISYLHGAISKMTATYGNYRYSMPLNGRLITMRQGVSLDVPSDPDPTVAMARPNDREVRTRKWTMKALDAARQATNDVKNLDTTLRSAAMANADVMAIPPALLNLTALGAGKNWQTLHEKLQERYQRLLNNITFPIDMEKTAPFMARSLADEAQQAVNDATVQIEQSAKDAAIAAAKQAARPVVASQGIAPVVYTPAPTVPPPIQIFPR